MAKFLTALHIIEIVPRLSPRKVEGELEKQVNLLHNFFRAHMCGVRVPRGSHNIRNRFPEGEPPTASLSHGLQNRARCYRNRNCGIQPSAQVMTL